MRLLQSSKYFARGVQARDTHGEKSYWPTSQWIFSGTTGNIEKASHTLLACDIVQFVWMCVVTHGRLIPLSKHA